jgi:hypothetical protein
MARFEEVAANRGVDTVRLGHEWMMVPHGDDNLVRLTEGTGFVVAGKTRTVNVKLVAEGKELADSQLEVIGNCS